MALSGKVALVTGAARGIGKGIALEHAKSGCDVSIADIDVDTLGKTADEIRALGRKCIHTKCDVASVTDVDALVAETVREFGRVDILAHAAGILRSCSVVEQNVEDWDRVVAVNLRSSFLLGKAVGRHMIDQKYGKMVFIDSCASKTGEAFNAGYCAATAGVRHLDHSLTLERAEHNINVNSIAPGTIDTEMIQSCLRDRAPLYGLTFEEYLDQFNESTPLKRMGTPEEVGKLAVFLSSDGSAFITGTSVNISGGRESH
ncbi:MAG: SDR family oxidoreductase [Planctomycetaceae bacterium]|nr:SDR family oxidoreductase [Planctomycetaceae bacterium]